MKLCKCCSQVKELSAFHKAKTGSQGVMAICASCRSLSKKQEYQDSWFHFTYRLKKSYSKTKGLDFNLTTEYLKSIWTEKCPIFGEIFVVGDKKHPYSPALDRIDPKKGYIKGNVCYISSRANRIKYDSSVEELKKILSWYEGATTRPKGRTLK